jgi:hypothetical protein
MHQHSTFPAECRLPTAGRRDTVFPRSFTNGITAVGRAALIVLGLAVAAHACNVPVFRFALERWRPDLYRVTVFHRGALSNADRALITPLEEPQDNAQLNLTIRTLDVAELDPADQVQFSEHAKATLPMLVVQYPAHLRIAEPAWSAPLSKESVALLTDSPIRRELVKRLTNGQTAVWLLLEGGDRESDDAAAKLVQEQIEQLRTKLKLPELTDSSEDKLLSATPLQVAFSVLRVSRGDAEQPLIQMLLHSESDLAERSDPMVFPVFGRGRVLFPLIGAGVTAENIHDLAAFLVGACSCEVKEQNPGFDLLLAANWDNLLAQDGVPLVAAAIGGSLPPGKAELIPIPDGSPVIEELSHFTANTSHNSVYVLFGVVLVVVGVLVLKGCFARR